MNNPIRWGIWGTGAVADHVAGDFRLERGGVLQAVASRNMERARLFASKHGAARCYEGLDALLHDSAVDIVYVATPNHRHLPDCLACIEAGKAVLCEKPFALTHTEAKQIIDAARRSKVFCMEAMWTRFLPAVIAARQCIDEGGIGAIRLIQGNFAYPTAPAAESRFFNPELGGGALLDRGVYLLSLAQQLLGAPLSARAMAWMGPSGVDEQSVYQLTYAGGVLADFSASLRTRGTNEVLISGETGLLRLCEPFYCAHRISVQPFSTPAPVSPADLQPGHGGLRTLRQSLRESPTLRLLLRRFSPLLTVLRRGRVQQFPFAGNGYQFELQHVNQCLRESRLESPLMPLDETLSVMRTMDELLSQMHRKSSTAAWLASTVTAL